jgi:hypothetical protein
MEEENEMKMNERKKKKQKKRRKKNTIKKTHKKTPKKWTMVTTQFNSIFIVYTLIQVDDNNKKI